MNSPTILQQITSRRLQDRLQELELVHSLTGGERSVPLVPFFRDPGLICEIKRSSPSRGIIIPDGRIVEDIFEDYLRSGAHRFSVLTESRYFRGSCADLYWLKQRHPELPFLRKDFLFSLEDIHESYLIGADAVLLIAALLDDDQLQELTGAARRWGLQVLTEIHNETELQRVLSLPELPDALGINSRDLTTFSVNIKNPFALRSRIPPDIPVIFESGVSASMTVFHAANAGFHGVLIGEACMSPVEPERSISSFITSFRKGAAAPPLLFTRLFSRPRKHPLVKVCGITTLEDARTAEALGADAIGLILASSPRSISPDMLKTYADLSIPKIAVIQDPEEQLVRFLLEQLDQGIIQGVQLHGSESPQLMERFSGHACRALAPQALTDESDRLWGPFTLFDIPKGSSRSINDTEDTLPLRRQFIAGGITPDNLEQVLSRFDPLLIDLASGIESTPGIKDPGAMKAVFTVLEAKNG